MGVFLSTDYFGKRVLEDDPLLDGRGLRHGYTQSKWVAEKLVQLARERGLPVTVYRPPLIGWHSQTGAFNESDLVCSMLEGCLHLGAALPDDDPRRRAGRTEDLRFRAHRRRDEIHALCLV